MHIPAILLSIVLGLFNFTPQSKIDYQLEQANNKLQITNQLLVINQLDQVPAELENYKLNLDKVNGLLVTPPNQVFKDSVDQIISPQIDLLMRMYYSCNDLRTKQAIRSSLDKMKAYKFDESKVCQFYSEAVNDNNLNGTEKEFLNHQIQSCNAI